MTVFLKEPASQKITYIMLKYFVTTQNINQNYIRESAKQL